MKNGTSPLMLDHAEGTYLYTRDGRKIFDGISSWWLITHGHAQPEIAEAIALQAYRLEQSVFANFTHDPAEELKDILGELLPCPLSQLFFSDNGSTAVEVAMKMAHQYMAQIGSPNKTKFVTFTNSYHGDTCGAMSVSGKGPFNRAYQKLQFDVLRAKQGRSINDPIETWTKDFETILDQRKHEICAVLIEPLIQGAGGMIVWPVEAVKKIVDLARQSNVLVIFDEVMTGFGRTGTLFAFEQVERTPDFLCLSKGLTGGFLPMGLTVTTEQIFEAFFDIATDKMFFHGHSFTGNALSCSAAVANLKLFSKLDYSKRAGEIQKAHHRGLASLKIKLPEVESRICGTIGILELNRQSQYGDKFSQIVHQKMLENNIFIRPLGNVIYLMPPFCIDAQNVEFIWSVLSEIL
jgi:adenosylmethionine-8-amino-7-oxononanoate aminotransferase